MNLPLENLPAGCLSDLQFDASFAGEARTVREVQTHIAGCASCRARHASLHAQREAFLAMRPTFDTPASHGQSATRMRWVRMGVLASAAAVALLWASPDPIRTEPASRLKGAPRIDYYVQRGATAARGAALAKLAPGDRVRFAYSSDRRAYLAVYGLDSRGHASVYFPTGETAAPVDAGSDRLLETAVELDDALGPEQVFAVFCEAPFALEPLRMALSAQHTLDARAGCRVERSGWTKERLP